MRYFLDLKQLESLGWKETIKFDEGLKQTVDWFCSSVYWMPIWFSMSFCLTSSIRRRKIYLGSPSEEEMAF